MYDSNRKKFFGGKLISEILCFFQPFLSSYVDYYWVTDIKKTLVCKNVFTLNFKNQGNGEKVVLTNLQIL